MPSAAASPGNFLRLNPLDNVMIARVAVSAGETLSPEAVRLLEPIAAGQKAAVRAIAPDEDVVKDGIAIGRARVAIAAGARVRPEHVANAPGGAIASPATPLSLLPAGERATFAGIVREDGRVGTRNFIAVVITVNCAATTARQIADHFTAERLAAYPDVDGVVALVHESGCGMEMTGEPMDLLRRTIAGTVRHPNVGAALLCSLGCERNNVYKLIEEQKLEMGPRLKALVMQERGGTRKTVEEGIAAIEAMLPLANAVERKRVSAEHLVVGLLGSGADAFSGLTADPAMGAAVDLIVRNGGTAIVAGTGELHGMEHALAARAATPEVAAKLARRIQWWEQYSAGRDTPFNGRLAPSHVAGGITTALERTIAASKRWGRYPLAEVCEYAHPVTAKGLTFMDTPAHEAVAATGQIAGGANFICMTTAHGTGFGSLPAPTLKLASHSAVYRRMQDDIDLDCGPILDGALTAEQMGDRIFHAILRHASGAKTKAEELGVGEAEFVPWPIGLTA